MSREVCGICWCPYDEDTGECACAPAQPRGAMSKEDIIRMAREAGLAHFYDSEGHCDGITDARLVTEDKERDDDRLVEMLAPFVHLVYEATFRDANIAASRTILDAAVLEEREACAQIADAHASIEGIAQEIATAIRARSSP